MTAWAKYTLALRDSGTEYSFGSGGRETEHDSSEEALRERKWGEKVRVVDLAIVGGRRNRPRLSGCIVGYGVEVVNLSGRIRESAVVGPI